VSKFFKALEKVEQEREAAAAPPPATPEASAATALVAEPAAGRAPVAVDTPAVAAPVVPVAPVVMPPPVVTTPVAAPPVPPPPAPPVTRPAPRRVEPAPVVAAASAPAEPAPTAVPFHHRRPEPRSTVYGAPVSRDAGEGRHAFAWQMEAVETEAGQIDDHLVSLLEPTSFAAEQYRAVRLAVETLRHERGTRVVGVSSPGRGEGKTITALNLAGALAQAPDARVVLIEADLRHPAAARYLGLSAPRGLSSYLLDPGMTLDAVLQRPPSVAFAVVPAGAASSMPYELLKSPRLTALLSELRQRFDFVLVDTPPALPFPDVGILRDLVDGFVVVVRANRTPREMLQDTMAVLGRPRTLGLVFNDDEHTGVPAFAADGDARWKRLMPRPLGARVA
jgi:capsular exopolysaccharide synthesis family protein